MSLTVVMPWAAVRRPDGTADLEAIDIWRSQAAGRTTYITDADAPHDYVRDWFTTALVDIEPVALVTEASFLDVLRSISDKGRGRPLFFDTDGGRIAAATQAGSLSLHLVVPTFEPEWRDRTVTSWDDVALAAASSSPPRSSPSHEDRIRRS